MGRPEDAKLDTDGLASDLARHLPLLTRHNLLESLASLRWLLAPALQWGWEDGCYGGAM